MRLGKLFVLSIAGVAIVVAGCQRAAQSPAPRTTEEGTMPVVNVVAKEFAFEPKEIKVNAGMAKFLVRNDGAVEHDFEIVGVAEHGAEHEGKLIQPSEARVVEVELKSGTYQVVCTVAGHKEAGMVATIVVI
ncbi:MAG: cupredoxin domain-containing protein [bacterium]